jgi:GDP-4-dehydro-6-deoxy-D-mannose reductase
MRSLITGAGGFVGRYLVDHLRQNGARDILATVISKEEGRHLDCQKAVFDIRDPNAVAQLIKEYAPQVIYHLAAMSFVPEAEENFQNALAINVGGTESLCKACAQLSAAPKFVFISSGEIYGRSVSEGLPLTEKSSLKPNNNYSATKVMAEVIVEKYAAGGAVNPVILRPFNHTGAGQSDRFVISSFAKQIANIKLGRQPPIIKVGNIEVQRDFSDVRDVVAAYALAAARGRGVYNVSSGRPVALRDVLKILSELAGVSPDIQVDPARLRGKEVPEIYSSSEKIEGELDWKRKYTLKDTLSSVLDYWLKA